MEVNLALVALLAVQQAFFMWQIHKLIDKAKSSSYTEYINATKPVLPKVKLPTGTPEDLGPLGEFNHII